MSADLTPEQVAELKAAFAKAMTRGKLRIYPPLPRKVRFRLWCTGKVDAAGIWLRKRRRTVPFAEALWRVTRSRKRGWW